MPLRELVEELVYGRLRVPRVAERPALADGGASGQDDADATSPDTNGAPEPAL